MKLNFFCNPFGSTGYATHARELLRELSFQGVDVACFPTHPGTEPDFDPLILESIALSSKARPNCFGLKLDVPGPYQIATFSGRIRIYYTVLETDRLPEVSVAALNTVDEVWTASAWGRDVFLKSGIAKPIRVVPEGVDTELFTPALTPHCGPYRFLSVGKSEERKNFECLLRAYTEEFSVRDDVELVIHCGSLNSRKGSPESILDKVNHAQIAPVLISRQPTSRNDLVRLFQSADAFVLPTHGEGWGLPIIEAMACGLPVITTGFGGMSEYVNGDTALLLDYKLVPAEQPSNSYFFDGGQWAEPTVIQLRGYLRWLFENREAGRDLGERALREVRAKWTWRHAALKALSALRQAGATDDLEEATGVLDAGVACCVTGESDS